MKATPSEKRNEMRKKQIINSTVAKQSPKQKRRKFKLRKKGLGWRQQEEEGRNIPIN